MNEETKDPEKTPGRAATVTVLVIVARSTCCSRSRLIMFAGVGTGALRARERGHLGERVLRRSPTRSSARSHSSSRSRCSRAPRPRCSRPFVGPARTLLAMGHYGALPKKFAQVSPRFFTPGYSTIVSAVVASVFYAVMRLVSENILTDTILSLGMMICFYYGLTAFACVWYFRKQWFDSARSVFFTFLFPLVGGRDPRGAVRHDADRLDGPGIRQRHRSIGGVGTRLHPRRCGIIVVGIVVMIWQRRQAPGLLPRRDPRHRCAAERVAAADPHSSHRKRTP